MNKIDLEMANVEDPMTGKKRMSPEDRDEELERKRAAPSPRTGDSGGDGDGDAMEDNNNDDEDCSDSPRAWGDPYAPLLKGLEKHIWRKHRTEQAGRKVVVRDGKAVLEEEEEEERESRDNGADDDDERKGEPRQRPSTSTTPHPTAYLLKDPTGEALTIQQTLEQVRDLAALADSHTTDEAFSFFNPESGIVEKEYPAPSVERAKRMTPGGLEYQITLNGASDEELAEATHPETGWLKLDALALFPSPANHRMSVSQLFSQQQDSSSPFSSRAIFSRFLKGRRTVVVEEDQFPRLAEEEAAVERQYADDDFDPEALRNGEKHCFLCTKQKQMIETPGTAQGDSDGAGRRAGGEGGGDSTSSIKQREYRNLGRLARFLQIGLTDVQVARAQCDYYMNAIYGRPATQTTVGNASSTAYNKIYATSGANGARPPASHLPGGKKGLRGQWGQSTPMLCPSDFLYHLRKCSQPTQLRTYQRHKMMMEDILVSVSKPLAKQCSRDERQRHRRHRNQEDETESDYDDGLHTDMKMLNNIRLFTKEIRDIGELITREEDRIRNDRDLATVGSSIIRSLAGAQTGGRQALGWAYSRRN